MRSLLLIACCCLMSACQAQQLAPPAQRLAGTWTSPFNGAVVDLIAEDDTSGVYIVQPPTEDRTSFTGSFSATQTPLPIVHDDHGPCPGTEGEYEFAILNGVMQLTVKSDDCEGRSEGTDYAWTRMFRNSN